MSELEYRHFFNCNKETLQRPAPLTDVSIRWECTVCDEQASDSTQPDNGDLDGDAA